MGVPPPPLAHVHCYIAISVSNKYALSFSFSSFFCHIFSLIIIIFNVCLQQDDPNLQVAIKSCKNPESREKFLEEACKYFIYHTYHLVFLL